MKTTVSLEGMLERASLDLEAAITTLSSVNDVPEDNERTMAIVRVCGIAMVHANAGIKVATEALADARREEVRQ